LAVNIFDFSGDDDYKTVRKSYYSDAIGVIMVFDVNIKNTFESLTKWGKEAEASGLDLGKCVVYVMGNKIDNKKEKRVRIIFTYLKEVKTEVAKEWARSKGYQYYETSAKTGINVSEAFKSIFDGIHAKTIENRAKYLY
jgi:small GTP-binding protein